MVSAAERLAKNLDMSVFARASDLKSRLLFVLGALLVYRIGTYIPIPGIDPHILKDIFSKQSGGVLGVFNMFSGGALGRMTIFALAIMPYISASIIVQLMGMAIPQLAALKKEGEAGRRKINHYTRLGTVVLAAVQGYGVAVGLEHTTGSVGSAVIHAGLFFRITTVITLTGGTIFLMWLGEQITARGIGNGISLIIFTGIVAELPAGLAKLGAINLTSIAVILIILGALALIALIVFVERAQRKIIVQYPKRQVGNKIYAGDSANFCQLYFVVSTYDCKL
jgi:preprotein translocase subunit SecY